ncbi:MAG: hypothetical protein KatS3mg130_2183 [Candidatus Sumerlaea sp.]|nr:MAG: hypothetical protein KatS3mg130_2183 [Candidatus Sumerlaea sp.]
MATARHSRKRNCWFSLLTLLAFAANVAGAYLNYVIWSDGATNRDLYETLIEYGSLTAGGIAFLCIGLTALAYALGLDMRRAQRPRVRTFVLALSFFLFLAGYFLGRFQVSPENFVAFAVAGVLVVGFAVGWLHAERMLGRFALRLATTAFESAPTSIALLWTRLALMLLPSNRQAENLLGMCLARLGKCQNAQDLLQQAYEDGARDPDLCRALAHAAEACGDLEGAARYYEDAYHQAPSQNLFRKLITLWSETGQKTKAIVAIKGLPVEDRRRWTETLLDLAFETNDVATIRELAREFEREGVPFNRAKACYYRLLEQHPRDVESLEALVELCYQNGELDEQRQLLERLVLIQPENPGYRRALIEICRLKGLRDDILAHLDMLVELRAANHEEKLEVLNEHFALANYGRVERLVRTEADLIRSMEARYLLAASYYETDRLEEALEELKAARSLQEDDDQEIRGKITGLESRIRQRLTQKELEELERKVQKHPDDLDIRFEYYDRLVALGFTERVVVGLEELLSRQPELRDRVVEELEKMLARHGKNFRLLNYLADINFREQNWDKVFELHEMMAADALHPEKILHEGALKILRGKPDHCPSLLYLARYEADHGSEVRALDYLSRYREAGGAVTPEVLELEFKLYCAIRDLEHAKETGIELLKHRPNDKQLLTQLAEFAAGERRYEEALTYLARVLALDAENAEIRRRMRELEEAQRRARMEELKRLLDDSPPNAPVLHMELGDLAHDFGMLNDAIVHYQRAAQDPALHNVALAKLAYVLASKGLFNEAEETLRDVELRVDQQADEQAKLKALLYRTAELMEEDKEFQLALQLYKRVFRVDAGYREVVSKIERLQRLGQKA